MADKDEIIYSDQGRFGGAVRCGAEECTFWARTNQADPRATANLHNQERHGGSLIVTRVESAEAR